MDWMLEDGYGKPKEKTTTWRRVESLDICTCREADDLKRRKPRVVKRLGRQLLENIVTGPPLKEV